MGDTKLWLERFGHRSERYIADPDQLRLDFGNTDDAADAAAGLADAVEEADLIPAHKRRKPRKKRDESLPEHLPRYEVTAEAPDEIKNCEAHGERTLLPEEMWDKTESLEFEPPVLKVRVTKHPEAIRHYRVEERQTRTARKRQKRAARRRRGNQPQ